MFFEELLKKINPDPRIAGLEVGDSILRYILLNSKGEEIKNVFLRLPTGIITDGKVKDKQRLIGKLKELKRQIGRSATTNVIVSVSSANVYLQTFTLPSIANDKLEEATRLNLEMISPVDISSSYSDWEILDKSVIAGGRPLNLLGGFIPKEIVDNLSASLEEGGFNVAVIEPGPLSLARVIGRWVKDKAKPYLILNLSGDGLDFFILKKGKLYFNHFTSWNIMRRNKGGISLDSVKNTIIGEMRRLIGFYTSNWGGLLEDMVLVGMADNREVFEYIRKNIDLNIQQVKVNSAVGAALRGLMPRADDHCISLARADTEKKLLGEQILALIRLWRNVAVAVLGVVLIIYVGVDILTMGVSGNLSDKLMNAPEVIESGGIDMKKLKKEADDFNNLVSKAIIAEEESYAWSPFFEDLFSLLDKRGATVKQVQIQQKDMFVVLEGEAESERGVIDFKNDLEDDNGFTDVSLPLNSIKTDVNGKASFELSFRVL